LKTTTFIWRYVGRRSAWIALAFAAILLYALASAAMVSLIEPIFGEVLMSTDRPIALLEERSEDSSTATSLADPSGWNTFKRRYNLKVLLNNGYRSVRARIGISDMNVVYFVPGLFLVVFLLRSFAGFLSGYSFQHVGLGMTTDIRNDLFSAVVNQSSRFHAEHPSGELLSRVVNDVSVLQTAISTRVLDLFQQTITLVVLFYLLFSTHFRLALVCVVAAPIFIFTIARFGKGMRWTSHRSQERMADLSQLLTEAVKGHRVVKSFGMEEFELKRFKAATRRHLQVKLRSQFIANFSSPVVESLGAIGGTMFLIYAGRAVRGDEVTGPLLVQFLFNMMMLYDPIRKLNKVNLMIQEASAALQRIDGIISLPNEIEEQHDAVRIKAVASDIAYEHVTFAYLDQPVLKDLNLKIEKGEIVALVGPSGAGKSTLINLLPRFFDPDQGRVTIDGIDIRKVTLCSLARLIGLVTQDTVLFDDTVRNNIAYGRADLPLSAVREAAAAAYADEFIMEMPEGYDSRIGEGGHSLSGGQRQRLSIARALLKDAPILILDEATSHLDTESEALVQRALYNLMRDRTTLVIAHRISTITNADRIVVMESGEISQVGTHEELLSRGGTYKRLYDLQFKV
jgi:subfamily B ATP-binding cassette protein MsbA